jgi:hypothetical protein
MRKNVLRKAATLATLGLAVFAVALPPSLPRTTSASSHREAPAISRDPSADATDIYAYVSPDRPDTVTFIVNVYPFLEPASGPNFYRFADDVLYELKIDNNGDALPDITYQWRFTTNVRSPNTFLYNTGPVSSLTDPNLNVYQTYSITRVGGPAAAAAPAAAPAPAPSASGSGDLGGALASALRILAGGPAQAAPAAPAGGGDGNVVLNNAIVAPWNIGPRSTPNYDALAAQAIYALPNGGQAFAGPRDDPFFADLGSIFDLGGLRPLNPAHLVPLPAAPGTDYLAGLGVMTMALQVPISSVTAGDPVIGVWATSSRAGASGAMTQVSRLGMPLVNEVVIPVGLKDAFNGLRPDQDAATLSTSDGRIPLVQDPELGKLIPVLYPGVKVPPAPRNDLVTIFLTGIPQLNQPRNVKPSEMLRLNTSIPPSANPNRMGVLGGDTAGFPNGRRLTDDVVDIELQAVAGATPFTPDFNVAPNNLIGDGVNANDLPFMRSFPYVPALRSGYETE